MVMGATKLFERLEFTRRLTEIRRKIDKQDLYVQAELTKRERQIFIDDVIRAELTYLLTKDTINVQPYRDEDHLYEGIAVVTVYLEQGKNVRWLAGVIQGAIPSPCMLVFCQENKVLITTAWKRLNKQEQDKIVIEKQYFSPWIDMGDIRQDFGAYMDSIRLSRLSFTDYRTMYLDLHLRTYVIERLPVIGKYIEKSAEEIQFLQDKIADLEDVVKEFHQIRKQLEQETKFNRKVELNQKLYLLKKSMESIQIF